MTPFDGTPMNTEFFDGGEQEAGEAEVMRIQATS